MKIKFRYSNLTENFFYIGKKFVAFFEYGNGSSDAQRRRRKYIYKLVNNI